MLSLVLLLSVAASGAGTCADHRGEEAVEIAFERLPGTAEAYAVAEYDFEDRLGELGLMGSTLAREAMAAGEDPAGAQVLALRTTVDPPSAHTP